MNVTELVRFVACSLVDKPDMVDVREVEGPESVTIELRVDSEDMGKVIGKQGRIAAGSGTTVQQVNQLIKQYETTRNMMKQVMASKGKGLRNMMKNLPR